jgi:hypothetical protein
MCVGDVSPEGIRRNATIRMTTGDRALYRVVTWHAEWGKPTIYIVERVGTEQHDYVLREDIVVVEE